MRVSMPAARDVKPGSEEWLAIFRHMVASVSEGLCPNCAGRLSDLGGCLDCPDQPGWWHVCQRSDGPWAVWHSYRGPEPAGPCRNCMKMVVGP